MRRSHIAVRYRFVSILLTIMIMTSSYNIWSGNDVAEAIPSDDIRATIDVQFGKRGEDFYTYLTEDYQTISVSYSGFVNSSESIAPGELKIRIPTNIIKDGNGNYAQSGFIIHDSNTYYDNNYDETVHSLEYIENYEGDASELAGALYYYTDSEDENSCIITNFKEIPVDPEYDFTYYQIMLRVEYTASLPAYFYSAEVPTDPLYMDVSLAKGDTVYTPSLPTAYTYSDAYTGEGGGFYAEDYLPVLYLDNSTLEATRLYIDAKLLLKGQTISYGVTGINSIKIGSITYTLGDKFRLLNDTEREFLSNSGINVNEYTYVIEFPKSELSSLYSNGNNKNIQANITYKATQGNGSLAANSTSRNVYIAGLDPTRIGTNQSNINYSKPLPLSPEVRYPCLYIGSYSDSNTRSIAASYVFLNGYWSELGETNATGYNQYEIEKQTMIINGDNWSETPEDSIKVSGKVYDYYSDDDLAGSTNTRFNTGYSNSTSTNFYYKFNDALSDYYKEKNQPYYDFYTTYTPIRDIKPDPDTTYSQSFGILNPLYIGKMNSGPIKNKNTSYGLFGIDKSNTYYYDPITNTSGNVSAVNRVNAITIAAALMNGSNGAGNGSAFLGIVADHLGENGEILMNTNNPYNADDFDFPLKDHEVESPFFNEDFLNGNNSLGAKIGRVFDATYTFDYGQIYIGGQKTYGYTLAPKQRFFFNDDGTINTELQREDVKATYSVTKELMPLNFVYNNQEYANSGYGQRIDIPLVIPADVMKKNYKMEVYGDDCTYVYLDGKLILDLGGLSYAYDYYNTNGKNNTILGTIDFKAKKATVSKIKTVTGITTNLTRDFDINDGRMHVITLVQTDNYTGEGALYVTTTLPLEYVIPEEGDPKSSYEVQNIFSSPQFSKNLTTFIDGLDFKNTVNVVAPHEAGEMDITPMSTVSLAKSYTGHYYDREEYEDDGWVYTDYDAIDKDPEDRNLGKNEIYAYLGLIYPGDTEIASNAYQKAIYQKTILDTGGGTEKDLTGLFNTTVTHYQGQGMYSDNLFLMGTSNDSDRRLQNYTIEDEYGISSIEYPGDHYGNFAWTNKTLVQSTMKSGKVTISKEVTNSPYEFLLDSEFTFYVYYTNIEDVFGTLPDEYDLYNGQPCIKETYTIKDGGSITINVPAGIECIVEEDDKEFYTVTSPADGYYDITVQENQTYDCPFTNEMSGIYTEQTNADISIDWVDDSNALSLRPVGNKYFTPYETYQSTDTGKNDTLIHIVFKGNDDKWYDLADAVGEAEFNTLAEMLNSAVSYNGDTTDITVTNLPKYVLPIFEQNAGSDVLTAGTEMIYGFTQSRYGTYVIEPFDKTSRVGTLASGETFVDTLYGSITISKTGKDSRGNITTLSDAEFDLYETESDAQNGTNPIQHLKTGNSGTAVSDPVPVSTYWLVENDVLGNYEPNTTPIKVEISKASTNSLNIVVPVENTLAERDVTITKSIDMTYGILSEEEYKSKEFNFTMTMSGLTPDVEYTLIYKFADTSEESETMTAPSNGKITKSFTLKDGDSVTFKALPVNSTYQVTEAAVPFYVPSYVITGESGSIIAKSHDETAETKTQMSTAVETVDRTDSEIVIAFKNDYLASDFVLPDSGMDDQRSTMVMLFIGIILFGTSAMIFTGRRKRSRSN